MNNKKKVYNTRRQEWFGKLIRVVISRLVESAVEHSFVGGVRRKRPREVISRLAMTGSALSQLDPSLAVGDRTPKGRIPVRVIDSMVLLNSHNDKLQHTPIVRFSGLIENKNVHFFSS